MTEVPPSASTPFKTRRNLIIGIAVSLLFLGLLFYRLDFTNMLSHIREANPRHLALAVVLLLLINYIRAVRWYFLLRPVKRIRFWTLFEGVIIGYWANFIFPVRLGEVLRGYVIGKREQISKMAAFSTVVQERLLDMAAVVLILFGFLLIFKLPAGGRAFKEALQLAAGISLLAVFCLAAFFIWAGRHEAALRRGLTILPSRIQGQLQKLIAAFNDGMQQIGDWRRTLFNFSFAVGHWLLQIIPVYIVVKGMDIEINLIQASYLLWFTCFAVALPSSPGAIGPYHAAAAYGLTFFNLATKEAAVAAAIVLHLVNVLPPVVLGTFFVLKRPFSIRAAIGSQTEAFAGAETNASPPKVE